jgi:hypothetical protein
MAALAKTDWLLRVDLRRSLNGYLLTSAGAGLAAGIDQRGDARLSEQSLAREARNRGLSSR